MKKENENLIINNKKICEEINKKEEEYNNLMNVNDENKNTFDTLLLKHNNLLEKYNNLNKENGQIKNEILDLRKVNDKLLKNMDEIEYQRKNIMN